MYTGRELRNILDNWDIEKAFPYMISISMVVQRYLECLMVGSDYILKSDSREKIVKNLKISRALHNQGFDSSLPVLTKTGRSTWKAKNFLSLHTD